MVAVVGAIRSGPCNDLAGYPSGQRGQTVNLVALPSQVRILLHPIENQLFEFRFHVVGSTSKRDTGDIGREASAHPDDHTSRSYRSVWCLGPIRARGCNSMVEYLPSKQATWVRFPSPASVGSHAMRGERGSNSAETSTGPGRDDRRIEVNQSRVRSCLGSVGRARPW